MLGCVQHSYFCCIDPIRYSGKKLHSNGNSGLLGMRPPQNSGNAFQWMCHPLLKQENHYRHGIEKNLFKSEKTLFSGYPFSCSSGVENDSCIVQQSDAFVVDIVSPAMGHSQYTMEGGGRTVALPPNKWGELENGYKGWVSKQCLPVEIATVAATHALQGAALGVLVGNILKNFRPFQKCGSIPLIVSLARDLALLRGTNGAMICALKRIRGGKDDTKARTLAGFTSGFMTSVIDDFPSPPNISIGIGIGLLFAVVNGLLHKVLSSQQPVLDDRCYTRTRCMLSKLGLQKYEKHFKKHLLTDNTMPLLNHSDLAEARIPLGPRVLILNHIERDRKMQGG